MYRSQALLSEHRLTHNLQELRKGLPTHTYVMPMLKANAYGHGDILLAPRLSTRNISVVGVANFEEAYRVIGAGFKGQIVCFGAFSRDELTHLPPRTILTLHNFEELQLLKELSSNQREGMCLHLEIDTGMNRLGFRASDKQELLDELSDLQLNVQGIFTHLSESEMADAEFSHYQHSLFEGVAAALEKKWGRKLLRHISNSGSILQFPAYTYDMIRPGIALYGYPPCLSDRNFLPLLEWRAPIAQLKTVEAGESISYNRTYTTQKKNASRHFGRGIR